MTLGRQILAALSVTLVSSVIVYGICLIVPKTYESEQVLLFPATSASGGLSAAQFFGGNSNQTSDTTMWGGGPGSISTSLVGSNTSAAMGILESRSCREYVVDKLDLARKWRMSKSKAVDELSRRGRVKVDDNGFLVITGSTNDAQQARDIAHTMYLYLNSSSVEHTINLSKRNREALEKRTAESEKAVDDARLDLMTTSVSHPYVDPVAMQDLLSDSLKKLGDARVALVSADEKIKKYEAMVARAINSGMGVSALQAVGGGNVDKALEQLAQDLNKHQTELELAKQTYTEKSPEFKAATLAVKADQNVVGQTIDEAKRGLKDNSFAPLIQARAELEALRKGKQAYEDILIEYKRMAMKSPGDSTIFKIKESQFETALKIAESNHSQLAQAKINEDRDPARSEVIDEAVVEPDPVAPRKGLITGAWAVGCMAMCSWLIVRRRIKFVD